MNRRKVIVAGLGVVAAELVASIWYPVPVYVICIVSTVIVFSVALVLAWRWADPAAQRDRGRQDGRHLGHSVGGARAAAAGPRRQLVGAEARVRTARAGHRRYAIGTLAELERLREGLPAQLRGIREIVEPASTRTTVRRVIVGRRCSRPVAPSLTGKAG